MGTCSICGCVISQEDATIILSVKFKQIYYAFCKTCYIENIEPMVLCEKDDYEDSKYGL